MKYSFFALITLILAILSIYILPPPITSYADDDENQSDWQIINSCIVNNTNIAIQNINEDNPIDANNNWWGMPSGPSYNDFSAGDLVGQNVIYDTHLITMPIFCDLSDADWVPFNEQDLQATINQNIPSLRGIGFALLDIQWGNGAKFDIISTGAYGGITGEAFISIMPSPDGQLMTLMIDPTRLPADPYLSQIVTCELMPLFLNSLQGVQNRYVAPSQDIFQMVVMDSSLMMRFTPLIETTPEPAPEVVLTYDTSCLPPAIPAPEPTPIPPVEEPPDILIQIPPLEGEFLELENNTSQAVDLIFGIPTLCNPNDSGWCALLEQVGDIFTYRDYDKLISVNRTLDGIVLITHVLPSYMTYPSNPSWGKVDNPNNPNHYRLAFSCTVDLPESHYHLIPCYWDSHTGEYFYYADQEIGGDIQISPDGQFIARAKSQGINNVNTIDLWNLATNSYSSLIELPPGETNFGGVRWSDADTLYFSAILAPNSNYIMHKVQNIKTEPTIIPIFEIPNLQPYIFDVTSDQLIYWSYDWSDPVNPYDINYHNVWSYSVPGIYPTRWSPYSDINNEIILIRPFIGNSANGCIDLFDVTNMSSSTTIACLEMDFGVSWASSIDLSALDTQPPPPPPPTGIPPQISQCLDTSRDPIAQKDAIIADCITALAWYGVTADASGLTSQWGSQASFALAWTPQEIREILIGVEKVADAFHLLTHEITNPQQSYAYNKEEAKAVFRLIIGDFYVLRVNNSYNSQTQVWAYFKVQGDTQNDSCDGTKFSACTSNYAQAVTFYDTISSGVTQYTMVHEIGHRFNARSDGGTGTTPASLFGRMQNARVCEQITRDTNGNVEKWCGNSSTTDQTVVFGRTQSVIDSSSINLATTTNGWVVTLGGDGSYRVDEWTRGNRGWGSGPGTPANEEVNLVITPFQQHSFHIDDWRTPVNGARALLRQREVDEATSDMFLNWVYRKLNPNEGFKNLSWIGPDCQGENGCDETGQNLNRFPGDRRFEWMNVMMNEIFRQLEVI
jgi:hypothetical protein